MKILAVAGLESPYLDKIEQVLNNAGLAPAVIKHEEESLTFVEWHDTVINNLDIDYRYVKENAQYHNQLALKIDKVYSADKNASLWGWADPKTVWTLDLWLDNKPNFHALLPCFSPDRWLASRLVADSQNLLASEYIEQWLEVHQQLLRIHFRYPDRTVLVDGYRCLSSPRRFLDYLTEKWHMPLDSEGVQALDVPEPDPLALLLAQQVAHANSEVWSLQQTIEASLEAFSPDMEQGQHEPPYLLDVALQSYRDMTLALCRLGSVESLFTDARQENSLLQARLTELEYLHEATLLNERGLITEVEKLSKVYQDQLDNGQALQNTVEVLKTELATQAAEVVECKGFLNKVAVELEGSRRSERDLRAELESLGCIKSEYNDLSEKTKQVQVQYQNAQEENTLLLQQVHLVQEELETVYLKTQEAEKKITELLAERDHHAHLAAERQSQVVALTSRSDTEMKAKAEAQVRIKALEQVQQELTAARDALAQEKTALTQARDAEAKAKAEALAQRDAEAKAKADALAQRDGEAKAKAEALAQRDAETKAKTAAQARVTKLEQAQQELTAARDALAQEKTALTKARDLEAKAKAEALAQRDALSEKTKHLQAEYQDSQEENTLLLQQLHLVQEELETGYLKTQEADKKITELLAERDHHAHLAAERQSQVVALTSRSDTEMKAKAEAQVRIKALEQVQQELTAARDALAQEKTALTQARDAEAKAKAEALAQRDAEAKAKADALAQRDAATKASTDAQARIKALEQTQQELTAARDALAQEKTALTQARDAEAKAKVEALAQRDAEAKAKADALAQRDAATKASTDAQARIKALEQAQQELTTARDALAQEKASLSQERDAEAKARAAAQLQLEKQAQSTNDFRNQVNALTMDRDTLQQRLEELEKTMRRASMTESELKKQTDKATHLEAELKDSQEENELLLQQLHLVQEELESLFLKGQDSGHASAELTAERDNLAKLITEKQSLIETLTKACDDLKKLSANRRAQIDAREKLITDLRERNSVLGADIKALHSENKKLHKQVLNLHEKPDQSVIDKLEKLAKSRRDQISHRDEVIKELRDSCQLLKKELHAQSKLVMTLEEKINKSAQSTVSAKSELPNTNAKA